MILFQETFDTVVLFLRKQGKPSLLSRDKTSGAIIGAYRSHDGCRCAAGVLIPDDKYSPDMERVSVRDWSSSPAQIIVEIGHNLLLVAALQEVHDELATTSWSSLFTSAFGYLADAWGLDRRVLQEVL